MKLSNIGQRNAFTIMLMLIILGVLSSAFVSGLGVAPSREILSYDTQEHSYTVRAVNNEHKDMTVLIYAQGELAQYATVSEKQLDISSYEGEKSFSYAIKLPENLEPGTRNLSIVIIEVPPHTDIPDTQASTIVSTVSVKYQLRVNVPYPGKYAEGVLYITESQEKNAVTITTNIVNKGVERINSASVETVIRGPTNQELARLKSENVNGIDSKSYGQVVQTWTASNPGEYYAEVIVNYDDKQFIIKRTFTVGNYNVEIKSLVVKNFKLGTVAKFDMDILNNWNQNINNAYGEIKIMDKQGNQLDSVKTVNFDMSAQSTTTISTYWDAKNIKVGEYDLRAIVYYLDKSTERLFKAVIGIDSIEIADQGSTAAVIAAKSEGKQLSLFYILVIISLIVNVAWFVYYKFLRKKKDA